MKLTFEFPFLLIISFSLFSCSSNDTKDERLVVSLQPDFSDNGKTVDSIKKAYNCESIEYDNWGDKEAVDSCLTVCLINSTKIPPINNVDETAGQFKAIALAMKKSLAKPQDYKTIYIVFVRKESFNGVEGKSHSAGMELATVEL